MPTEKANPIPKVPMRHRKFRLWNCLSYSQNSETAGGNVPFQIPPVAESHCKFRLWNCPSNSQNSKTAGGNVPFQVPPLELSELFSGRRNGGITQSNGQYDRSVTAAMCCFKFRLWLKATVNSAFGIV